MCLCHAKGRRARSLRNLLLRTLKQTFPAKDVVAKACEVAELFAAKPSVAWKRTKAGFREIALSGFDEAFRAGVLGQQEAYAKGEPQAVIGAFLNKKR